MKFIDPHTHTNHSDGTSTVINSLQCAEELGLLVFSVSDHNTVSAYREIAENRELFSGKILPAVELSTIFDMESIEILGYGIDLDCIEDFIKTNYKAGTPDGWLFELKAIVDSVLAAGLVVSDEYMRRVEAGDPSLKASFGGAKAVLLEELKKFPENATLFGGADILANMDRQVFNRRWLSDPKSPMYCDKSLFFPSMPEVVEAIHKAGGLCFLAHAFSYSSQIPKKLDVLAKMLDGFECHYGTFTKEQKAFLTHYCDKNGLLKSGGSDFHGLDMRPKNRMGYSAGERIEYDLCSPWLDKMTFV